MASGKKNYFRHSIFARNDEVIIDAMHEFGFKAYFFWFALLELCGEQASDFYPEKFVFHESRLKKELRCSKRTLRPLLDYFQTSLRLSYNLDKNFYQIEIPNFRKYMGFYTNKKEANTSKERKEKKRKVKERKGKRVIKKQVPFPETLNFLDAEQKEWLAGVTEKMAKKWLNDFKREDFLECLEEAMIWDSANSKWKSKPLGLNGWLKRSGLGKTKDDKVFDEVLRMLE